jgi:hypothetical protein
VLPSLENIFVEGLEALGLFKGKIGQFVAARQLSDHPVTISAEVLSSLQNIFVKELEPSGPFQENIGRFIVARQLSGHPVAISEWDK